MCRLSQDDMRSEVFRSLRGIHRERLFAFARAQNPEGLAPRIDAALATANEHELSSLGYYLLRQLHQPRPVHRDRTHRREVQGSDDDGTRDRTLAIERQVG